MYNKCDEVLSRIKDGLYYNRKLKLYTEDYLLDILKELENNERFEDCIFMKSFIAKRFNYLENYKNPIL